MSRFVGQISTIVGNASKRMRWADMRLKGIRGATTMLERFIQRVSKRKHDLIVGTESDPVYYRWHVWPRNCFLNCYLHHFVSDDDSRALHDHRAANISVLLVGAYDEVLFNWKPKSGWALPLTHTVRRNNHTVVGRRASTKHRIVMLRDPNGVAQDCWSLFIKLPDYRDWGFACTDAAGGYKWRPWQEYSKPGAYGEIGKGCGE